MSGVQSSQAGCKCIPGSTISPLNSISALCELTEANVSEVAKTVGKDSRIGPRFLNAGIGFGGSCFQKDILNLVYIAKMTFSMSCGTGKVSVSMNEYQKRRLCKP